ncbi:glycoside hydrolase family 13 protein [Chitinimonas lacunae]|uniref:Glycoside hydrolase family 13 protein n=1 Tax=Chitinimonas lacunae TaxID=1963018 RepID=A0ABV8MMI2_9NEIS
MNARPDAFTRRIARQVVYQIFPERFAIGRGLDSAGKLADPAYQIEGAVARDWNDSTMHQPWAQQFFGGDLDGIADRLDYLQMLGIDTLYLTPIFSAPSNHKYDATDFFCVDPMFGGDAALDRLLNALRPRAMGLLLDAVLNHVSDRHPWFLAAQAGDSNYRNFFGYNAQGEALCWQDFGSMPELNLANPEVRDRLYRQPDSVVQYWLARGISGWRFDVAQDVGIEVAEDLVASVGKRYPDALLLGELNGFSGSWFDSGQGFHGMMNYWYRTALLAWLGGEIDAIQMNRAISDARQGYGLSGLLCSWNMLSSHDTPRLLTSLGSSRRVRLAQLAQFTLPGVPLLYYGEEIGMEGGPDPDCRRPMRWNPAEQDQQQLEWTRRLIALRRANPALQYGDVIVLGDRLPGNALVYLRHTERPGEAALIVINLGEQPLRHKLLLPYSHWYDGVPLRDALGNCSDTRMAAGAVQLDVPAGEAALYQAFEPYNRYTFFKPRNGG